MLRGKHCWLLTSYLYHAYLDCGAGGDRHSLWRQCVHLPRQNVHSCFELHWHSSPLTRVTTYEKLTTDCTRLTLTAVILHLQTHTDRQTDRYTDTHRQTDRQIHRHTQTDRQTDTQTQTDRHNSLETYNGLHWTDSHNDHSLHMHIDRQTATTRWMLISADISYYIQNP